MCKSCCRKWPLLWYIFCSALRARSVQGFYDAVAPVYDAVFDDHLVHLDTIMTLLRRRYPEKPERPILDLACGTGVVCRTLARQGYETMGVDCSARSLEILHRHDAGIPVLQGSAESLPLASQSVQAIVCLGAWRHFNHPETVVMEMHRTLVPTGDVIIGYFPPKLGAFWQTPSNGCGRFLAWLYMRLLGCLGYTDHIDAEHEEETIRILRAHFTEVAVIPSGKSAHVLHAQNPA